MLTVLAVLARIARSSANTGCEGCARGDADKQYPDKCLWPDRGCEVCHIDLRGFGWNLSPGFALEQLKSIWLHVRTMRKTAGTGPATDKDAPCRVPG